MTEISAFRTKSGDDPVFYVAEVNPHTAYRNPSTRPASMNFNDPISPETQPSMQPKRTFPWDYAVAGKRHTNVPELKSYTPNMSRNVYGQPSNQPTNSDREVRFSLDNPACDEPSSRNHQIEKTYAQDHEDGYPIPTKIVEPGLQRNYRPSSTVKQKDTENMMKKKSKYKYCVLIIIIIVLLLLLLTMTGLFIWKMLCCNENNHKLQTTAIPAPATSTMGCKVNPNPVAFTTLPQRVLEEFDNFSAFLAEKVNKNQASAVSVNVVYGDKVIWEKGLGVLNKTEQPLQSPNSRTMYPCASVSKILTAVMFFKLVNDARVPSLDDKVVRYETSFSVKNPFNNLQITLRELAAHRSGLMREAPCYPIPEGSTNLCPNDYNTMLNRIKNLTLLRSPGSKPQYSNLGYSLLGRVLFHSFSSSGLNFDQWMKNELFSKLNMMNTTFSPSNSQKLKMPVGYLDGTYVNHIYDWGWLQPTGGMFSTVDDMSKLLIELMTNKTNNRLLSTSLTEEFFKPDYIFPDIKTIIGTPWEMKQHDGYIIREKTGYIYGYNSYVAMVPEIRLGINMFCTDCQQKLGSSIPNYFTKILSVFKEEFVRASAKNFTLPPDSKPFLGQYNSSIPTLKRIDIKEKPGHLTFAVNDYDLFFMNSTGPLTFKISVNPNLDCMNAFTMGVENEVLFFDKPSTRNGKSPGFVMFGASVDGRTYFTREN